MTYRRMQRIRFYAAGSEYGFQKKPRFIGRVSAL